jgi:hypothetical protein
VLGDARQILGGVDGAVELTMGLIGFWPGNSQT